MYILDFGKMRAGDIILTKEDTFNSKVIRTFTRSDYSHALLYVGHGGCMHSDRKGVHSFNAQRLLFSSETDVKVLRLKDADNLTSESWKSICDFTRYNVGVKYAYTKALKAGIASFRKQDVSKSVDQSPLQFCSLLISEAYKCANIELYPNPAYCVPGDIAKSDLLCAVTDPTRRANSKEILFANDKSKDKIAHQTRATNYIFQKAKQNISNKINTFEDLHNFALQDRAWDLKISKIIEKSGYLKMPEYEYRDCAWRYEYNAFQVLPLQEPERKEFIMAEASGGQREVEKYEFAVTQNSELYDKHKLLCLKGQIKAYRQMLELSHKRSILFNKLLAEYTNKP